jgi:hypothetical protein
MRLPARGIAAIPLALFALSLTAVCVVGVPVANASPVPTPYSAAAAAAASAIPAAPRPPDPTVGPRITRQQILQNALGWLAQDVPYSQTRYFNGVGDPLTTYRTDCSGFVSMAWQTDVRTDANNWNGGYVTWTLPNIATRLPSVLDLQPGDILDNLAHHVILFTGWVNKAAGTFSYIAQTEPGLNMQAVDSESVLGGSISGYAFSSFVPYTYENITSSGAVSTVTGDWDLNGTSDLLTQGGSLVSLWQGNGAGRFRYGKPALLRDDFGAYVALVRSADISGDRIPDLVGIDSNGVLWAIPGNGVGGFLPRYVIGRGWAGYKILAAGDFNGDGRADLLAVAPSGDLLLYAGRGGSVFDSGVAIGRGWTGMTLFATGAFQGPGTMDIVASDPTGTLWLYPADVHGALHGKVEIGRGWTGWHVFSPGDFTGDHNPDLIGVDSRGYLWLYPSHPVGGKAGFSPRVLLGNGWGPLRVF